jgi:hypothetical protein
MWIDRNCPHTIVRHVVKAFIVHFGLDPSYVQVVCHNPANFLVTILDRDAFEEIAGRDSFPCSVWQFRLQRWSPRDNATKVVMRYLVRLCLEGLPLHLWSDSFATMVIGRSCSLYFAEERSTRREATDIFELTAWSTDLVAIPLRVWVTVTDPDHGSPRVVIHRHRPAEPRRGMVYDIIILILSIEDTRRRGSNGHPLFFPFRY